MTTGQSPRTIQTAEEREAELRAAGRVVQQRRPEVLSRTGRAVLRHRAYEAIAAVRDEVSRREAELRPRQRGGGS